jgi:ADP-ribosyl-[dinitrogen reductase] hydrolase
MGKSPRSGQPLSECHVIIGSGGIDFLDSRKLLNSINSPLRIEHVEVAGGGQIGMTLCPGKKIVPGYTGDWDRDLETDIQAIAGWGAEAVVTLMEEEEFSLLKVPDLGEAVERAGMEWHHLPIPDVSTPRELFENLWVYSGHLLRRALASGRKVLIHCRGGLGRTGMIAARLLVEMGEKPAEAIRRVRSARPGTIETSEQEKYVRSVKAPRLDPMLLDRILGCLLGGAVGDAMGYAVEFDSWHAIKSRFGADGIVEPVVNDGRIHVSDDTQMTLFAMEGLARSGEAIHRHDLDAIIGRIRLEYLDWLDTQHGHRPDDKLSGKIGSDPRLRRRMAPGNTCLSALESGGRGSMEHPLNDSKGCGGVMRVAPIGLLTGWRPEDTAELAARAAVLTHGHASGYLSAAAMAAIVRLSLNGIELAGAARQSSKIISGKTGAAETINAIDAALSAASREASNHRQAIGSLGDGGWCGEDALAIGLYSAIAGQSFPQVLSIAANHDGDSDSTASIAGQLYGASKGLADLPHKWIRCLDVLDILLGLVREMLV